MKQYLGFLFCFLSVCATAQNINKTIFGIVTDGIEVLQDVSITNKASGVIVLTDASGKYKIQGKVGDVLQYAFAGMRTKEIVIEDVTRILNVRLKPNVNFLEEVTVTERLLPQEKLKRDYDDNKRIIKWGFLGRYVNTASSAGRWRVVDLEDNIVAYACLGQLLQVKFPQLRVSGCASSVFLPGASSILNPQTVSFDVDGQFFRDMPEIPIYDIRRVAVLFDLASRSIYGPRGAGGVVVINTWGANPIRKPSISKKLGIDNIYEKRKSIASINSLDSEPKYLTTLANAKTTEDAKTEYSVLKERYSSSPYFFLDAYQYFQDRGKDDFADTIIEKDFQPLFNNNPVMLKALGYIYQEQGRYQKANDVFKQVFILRPNYAQSYLDLANSYDDIGDAKFAIELHSRYNHLVRERFMEPDTVFFEGLMNKELKSILARNKEVLSKSKKIKFPKSTLKNDVRVVFEWNDGDAEFDIEFLQGEYEYYVYNHTYEDSAEDINREKRFGYNIAEYVIDERASTKPWQINIKYLGNMTLTTTYLKVTTYSNYGSAQQSKNVRLFKLNHKNANQKLFTL